MAKEHKMQHAKAAKKNRKWKAVLAGVLILLLVICAVVGFAVHEAYLVKEKAMEVKDEATGLVALIKESDMDEANAKYADFAKDVSELEGMLEEPLWNFACKLPKIGSDVSNVKMLVKIASDATTDIIEPVLEILDENPIDTLKIGDGYNVNLLSDALDFLIENRDTFEDYKERLETVKFTYLDVINIEEYSQLIETALQTYDEYEEYLLFAQKFLNGGKDKYYLLVAQNTAEIRASGGFPGSIGTVVVEDGVLTIGEFQGVKEVVASSTPKEAQPTQNEVDLFSFWIYYPWDLCYNPNFERIAYQLSKSCLDDEIEVDGVISVTPVIIGRLLDIFGTVELSDGTVLTGENATKYLQRDIYVDCFTADSDDNEANEICDGLFVEAAKKVISLISKEMTLDNAISCIDVLEESIDERVLEMWFADEDIEKAVKQLGCSGGLEYDDATGIYISNEVASKMGWFLEFDADISEPEKTDDGLYEYEVTMNLKNTITKEEIKATSWWVRGQSYGMVNCFIHLFPPTDGKISKVKSSNGQSFLKGKYEDLVCYYNQDIVLYPGKDVTITYTVTTSCDNLRIVHTPTLN